jgi:membrane protein
VRAWGKAIGKRLHFLWEAFKKFDDDNGFFLSSGVTFNLLICFVPLLLLLLALVGTYLSSDREVLSHLDRYIEGAIPSLDPKIMESILTIIHNREIVGGLGIVGLAWTSTWVFSSLRTALNAVFQVEKRRGILRGKAVDLLMVFLAGLFLWVSMLVTSSITLLQGYRVSSFVDMGALFQMVLKYLLPFFFTYWMAFFIYKIIPNRKIGVGIGLKAALFTSFLWEAAKQFFGWYVLHLGRFSILYGSLSTLAIFFFWIYYSSSILLLGGEIAFLLQKGKK